MLAGADAGRSIALMAASIIAFILIISLSVHLSDGGAVGWQPVAQAMANTLEDSAANADAKAEEIVTAPHPQRGDYPYIGISSRSIVWVIAQMHLNFAAFVLAVPIFVVLIEWLGLKTGNVRYDHMAREFMKISMSAYSITALFGGLLTLVLFMLYPDLMRYMMHVFGAQMLVYAFLFIAESLFLYVYYYSWDALGEGNRKWLHLTLGLMLNTAGTTLLVLANSWATFMMAPSGVNEVGEVIGSIWEIMRGPLWNPLNLHRFLANIAFGGAVVGAYAAYRFLSAKTAEEKAAYDWMGYTSNFIAILSFLPLPFAGYWLMAEVYAYSQSMGITAMGGILSWLFIVQAVLIGAILLAGNYYLWSGMERSEGSARYQGFIKYITFVLVVSFLVWVTPHTLILTPAEMKALGGSHHQFLGALGVMPAKNIAVNLMLIFTFLSFQLYRRSDKVAQVSWEAAGNAFMVTIYTVAVLNIVFAGVYYGYFTSTVYNVGSSVIQVASTLMVIVAGITIDGFMYKGAKTLPSQWGRVSNRSQYALFALPITFTWLMALMGYLRSSIRTDWHITDIMRDNSPDNFIPAIGYAGNMITMVTVLFVLLVLFVFWVATRADSGRQKVNVEAEASKP